MILTSIYRVGNLFLQLLNLAMIVYCVMSWFQPRFQAFYTLRQLLEPFVAPFRTLAMKAARYFNAPIDFTFLFAIIGYQVIARLWRLLFRLLTFRIF